ncbi:hypothetical protein R1sor_009697 [Riccia sorocarpa]|uniref:RING-type domain-containing protein n=1 Tax=Riccia sorocarpa TaxID=122646 RepID=A0ABD3HZY6_9MARC
MGGGGAADDDGGGGSGSGSGSGSHVAIVPSGEGPSSAPSPSSPSAPSPSWLPHADREALMRWIESSPFVFVDRQHHESARARLKLVVAEAEVARLMTQLELTEEAVRVERLRNFADGSDRAAWDVERTTLQRDVDFARESRDQDEYALNTVDYLSKKLCYFARIYIASVDLAMVRVYEELHSGLHQELAEAFGRTRAEEDPRRQWELLRIDMKMIVVRGNKAMWPPAAREVWNTANRDGDLERIATFFPGWAPLAPADGGTIGLSPIWHRKDCGVCHNFFGPEGGYMPGSCSHPVHIACLLKLIVTGTSCVVYRFVSEEEEFVSFDQEEFFCVAAYPDDAVLL